MTTSMVSALGRPPVPLPRIVLLGGSGFAGRAVAKSLHSERISVEAPSSSELDLTRPEAARRLARLLGRGASLVSCARARLGLDEKDMESAEDAMRRTLVSAIEAGRPDRVVLSSTLSVYADDTTNLSLSELTAENPPGAYGRARLALERAIQGACAEAGSSLTVLRCCKLYGPGEGGRLYGPSSFCEAAASGKPLHLVGDGTERRDHLYLDDFVAVTAAAAKGALTGLFVAGSGDVRSYAEIGRKLEKLTGRRLRVERTPRTRPQVDLAPDVAKLRASLPGARWTPLDEGLAATLRDAEFRLRREEEQCQK